MKATRVCSIDGCDRAWYARDWCNRHYNRWRRNGDPGPAAIAECRRYGAGCSVAGCDRKHQSKGLCSTHLLRVRKHGSTQTVVILTGADHPLWRGDAVSYRAAHARTRRARGSASAQSCRGCAAPAEDWAYDHADPNQLTDERGRPYSADPARYVPMCRPCHRKLDAAS